MIAKRKGVAARWGLKEAWSRSRTEGGRTYLGRSVVCRGSTAEGRVIGPDRAAEVSRGQSSSIRNEGPNGPRRGLMGKASKQRNS